MTTYKKPANLKYTAMAIYVDKHAYDENPDVDTIYQYIYHLVYMLAIQKRFFHKAEDYDNYSLCCASIAYMRLRNPKQYLPEDDPRHLPRIKSILNYVKKILYPIKVNYQQDTFNQIVDTVSANTETLVGMRDSAANEVVRSSGGFLKSETEFYISRIAGSIKAYLKRLPYSSDKLTLNNIYISCLLSLLKSITLNKESVIKIQERQAKGKPVEDFIDRLYQAERLSSITLYHLNESMRPYITVLVNKIRSYISDDLRELIGFHEPADQVIKSVLKSSFEETIAVSADNAVEEAQYVN